MKTFAAVAVGAGKPLEVMEVDLEAMTPSAFMDRKFSTARISFFGSPCEF
ncbi:MAG: hypothetical protein ABJH80_20590 [Nitratireductor sp.]